MRWKEEAPLSERIAKATCRRTEVYLDPASHHFLGDRLFMDDPGRLNGDRQNAPYAHLRDHLAEQGIPVHTADFLPASVDGETVKIYFSLGRYDQVEALARRPDVVLSGFFAMECPIVEPSLFRALPRLARRFRRVFSWSDSPSLRRFTGADLPLRPFRWPQSFDTVHAGIWENRDRKFLVMINANKLPRVDWQELYTERLRAVEFFARTGEIDLYGKGWDRPSVRVGNTWVPWTVKRPWLALQRKWKAAFPDPLLAAARRAWHGPVVSKAETFGRYNFALCFENCILRGWITEKIFDCFFAGTVPVYWGAPEIADVVPTECFIDMREFSDYAALRRFLRSLSPADVDRYREAARDFLGSAAYRPFTCGAFTSLVEDCVAEDGGLVTAAVA